MMNTYCCDLVKAALVEALFSDESTLQKKNAIELQLSLENLGDRSGRFPVSKLVATSN